MQRVLDAISGAPAWVHNDRLDFLAANRLGYALYSEMFTETVRPVLEETMRGVMRGCVLRSDIEAAVALGLATEVARFARRPKALARKSNNIASRPGLSPLKSVH